MSTDLVVVGAGPAGLTAALAAAEHGLSVTVVDEQHRPGGQIFRRPPAELGSEPWSSPPGYPWAADLLGRADRADALDWRLGTTALGLVHEEQEDDGLLLVTHGPGGTDVIRARRLLVATGAFDMPVPVPGWTLPGVMTAGAVQTLLKSQRVLAADRLVLAGSHPLLLVVADLLRRAGADVAEVAFARGLPTVREALGSLRAVPGHTALLADAARSVARLRMSGTSISTSTIVTAAHGEDHVSAVSLAPVDQRWRPTGPARRVATEALVLGYGFQPATELARQARCAMRWDSAAGGWVVVHDGTMRTSVPEVYVAGEPAGINGAETARAQGRLAGRSIAAELTGTDVSPAGADRSLRRARRFSRVVQTMFEPRREALLALAQPATPLCRCELVSREQVGTVLETNPEMSSVNAVKLECRSGMGTCQGRYCEMSVSTMVAGIRGLPADQVGYFAAHLPVKPVPLSVLAELDGDQPGPDGPAGPGAR